MRVTLPNLRRYAAKQSPNAIAGRSGHSERCPVAVYLRARTGRHASVGPYDYSVGVRRYSAPPSLRRFVIAIDSLPGRDVTWQQVINTIDRLKGGH